MMARIEFFIRRPFVKKWLLFSFGAGILIPLFYYPQGFMSLDGFKAIYDDILYSTFISIGISGSVGLIEQNLNRLVPWIEAPVKRLLVEIALVTVIGFTVVFIITFLFFWSFGNFTLGAIPWWDLLKFTTVPMMIGYGITAFFISRGFLMEWRQAAVDAEKLRSERYKGQVRLLKDQLNPHFLFNSLNVLTNTVYEDADKAAHYIRQLSRFYRHVLEVQDEEVVDLKDELDFTKSYFELQQSRFGNSLTMEINIDENADYVIPPLVLQMLVENAIKHNRIGDNKPLKIEVTRNDDRLIVRNNRIPKVRVEKSTGIGLNNIRERYSLLSDHEVIVSDTDDIFEVNLPLLTLK